MTLKVCNFYFGHRKDVTHSRSSKIDDSNLLKDNVTIILSFSSQMEEKKHLEKTIYLSGQQHVTQLGMFHSRLQFLGFWRWGQWREWGLGLV